MTATVYVLSSSLHWYKSVVHEDITDEEYKNLKAYEEEYQGQVRIEYS